MLSAPPFEYNSDPSSPKRSWQTNYPSSMMRGYPAETSGVSDTPVALGTSILAVTYDKGVILGADSRTSTGTYIANRVADKITPISDKVYALRSGSASDTQAILSYVQHFIAQHQEEAGEETLVKTAAYLMKGLTYQNKDNLSAGLIVAGWDKHAGGQVWGIPQVRVGRGAHRLLRAQQLWGLHAPSCAPNNSGASLAPSCDPVQGGTVMLAPFAAGGSGSSYICGWLDKFWKPNMTEAQAKQFVVKALTHAMARDASSGGCIRTVTIDENGARRDFLQGSDLPLMFGELAAPAR